MVWQARPQPQPTPAGPDTTQTGPCFPNIARGRVRRRIAPTDAGRPHCAGAARHHRLRGDGPGRANVLPAPAQPGQAGPPGPLVANLKIIAN